MKAIILAAGEDKRLQPLTENIPKSLVSIWGRSLLERQLDQLEKYHITDICIVTGYCKEKIEQLGFDTVFNDEYRSTNMVFSLSKALPRLAECASEQVLILYGDIAYSDSHLARLITSSAKAPMTVLGNTDWYELWRQRMEDPLTDAETFLFDAEEKLLEIGKVPTSIKQVQAQYMGMIKVDTHYLINLLVGYVQGAMTGERRNMYVTELVQQVVDTDFVQVELVSGGWIEIDTIEDYQLYSSKLPLTFGLSD